MSELRKILLKKNRPDAEAFFASHTRSQYVGDNTLLCQVLGNHKMFFMANDIGFAPHMVFDGYWEFWLTKYFAEKIKPGDYVIDIGANQGYYTILASELVGPQGKVLAIEPNPQVFSRLLASAQVNGFLSRIEARNVALALDGADEAAPFWLPHGDPKNARFVFPGDNQALLESLGEIIEVPAIVLEPESFARVDFIKIDVEGAEIGVLKQCRPIIERFRPGLVCEVNFGRHYDYDDLVEAIGTDKLLYLDFNSVTRPFTREMAETVNVGEDWLICLERTT
jgi:FkbM family methyltransferase